MGQDLNICGRGNVGWVLVVALAGCLPWEAGGSGGGVVAVGVIVGGWIVGVGRYGSGKDKGACRVREPAGCQGEGKDATLEGGWCPNCGVGACVVEYHARRRG